MKPAFLLTSPLTSFPPFQNGELQAAEIVAVYTDMLGLRYCKSETQCSFKKAPSERMDTVISRAQSQKLLIPTTNENLKTHVLAPERSKNVENWVEEQKRRHSKLDKEAFVKAVCGLASSNQKDNQNSFHAFFSLRNFFYGPAVLLFIFGGLWALLAVNAMNERFQIRHDIDLQQIGTLNSIYFVAGIFSPFIGGYIMDHYAGPGLVACGSTSITTIGAVLQWLANTPERYILLLVGRFLIGFGLETTFFASFEVIG
jgi:hypothetical protein